MESGSPFSFRISIRNGIFFSFSSPGSQIPMSRSPPTREVRKKTPSMLRRNRRRWEDFQLRKSSNSQNPTPRTGFQPPEIGSPSQNSESEPMVTDSLTPPPRTGPTSPASGSHSQPQGTGQHPVSQPPSPTPTTGTQRPAAGLVKSHSPRTGTKQPVPEPVDEIDNDEDSEPETLSVTTEQKPSKKKLHTEELHLSLCAPNIAAAAKFGRKFAKSTYVGPHPRNEQHFIFSTHIENTNLNQIKSMLNEFNENMNLIKIRVLSENKSYFPDKPNHCQKCVSCHNKK